jgi:hypothetical protein
MAKGYVQRTSDSPYVAEIMRQELFNIQSAVILAWDHATKAHPITGRSKQDVADAVYEREQHLIDLSLKIANNPECWVGIVELFDTPPPILEFFEKYGVKLWTATSEEERFSFADCLFDHKIGAIEPVQEVTSLEMKPKCRRRQEFPVRYRYTHEAVYRSRIRAVMKSKGTISMRELGADPFLPQFVLISPDIRLTLETTCRSEPEDVRRADVEQSLVLLHSYVIQHLVVRSIGVNFKRQLLTEIVEIEWFLLDGEPIDLALVMCCCDAHILVGSKEELPFVADPEFLVDKFLFRVERSRVANEISLRKPREGKR